MSREQNQSASAKLRESGLRQAVGLLHDCCTEHGFLASPTNRANYRRIWGRDSSIISLAALLTDDRELIECARRSIETLAKHQGPHGEIPSNVDPTTGRISYGGTAGRVDADLWFLIACGSYWRTTGDDDFLRTMLEPMEKVRFLLGCWEFNTRGLLYVPPTGDWADEYLQSGYVLYDNLLYLQAQRELCAMHRQLHHTADHNLDDRVARLKHLIRANYWFDEDSDIPEDVYHEVLYQNGRKATLEREHTYWMAFFTPFGYGFRFDAMANALAILLGVSDEQQNARLDEFIDTQIVNQEVMLLPAFHPVIRPKDEQWEDLQVTFSHTFKNEPYEYHNGGLWPLVTSFYAAGLAMRGRTDLAEAYVCGIHAANQLEYDGVSWSFPEFVHGLDFTPGGTAPMAWSAAAAIIADKCLDGQPLFDCRPLQ